MLEQQIKMSNNQIEEISNMLQTQGLNQAEINEILNGNYSSFQNSADLSRVFSSNGNHQNVLRGLADGYSISELQSQGVSQKDIDVFLQELEKYNLTIDNAKAINQYSNGSNMILAMKKNFALSQKIERRYIG